MNILKQFAPNVPYASGYSLSCFLETERSCIYLLNNNLSLYQIKENENCNTFSIRRPYKKIVLDPHTKRYYAISGQYSDSFYILDDSFTEIDFRIIRLPVSVMVINDICFHQDQILSLISDEHVLRYNLNGDYLGTWMSAPRNVRYQAMCTYENNVILSYVRSGCAYLASYTSQGIFLEELALGSEYVVVNLQVFCKESKTILRVFANKDCRNFVVMDVDLLHQSPQQSNLSVECMSEETGIQATCFIDQDSSL